MIRLGVDFGGTKIEVAAIDEAGAFRFRRRAANPRDYDGAIRAVNDLLAAAVAETGASGAPIGVGIPGSVSPVTGLVRNANSTWLNGRALAADLAMATGRPARVRNDANCFALSEATDGAGAGADVVFGVILGTGCGGGVVVGRELHDGANGVAGEWGHTPLPWPTGEERGERPCWCGRSNCLETWISGTAVCADYRATTGVAATGDVIVQAMRGGDSAASLVFARYVDRLARGLAVVCDILDPDVIVLGGGMSNTAELYDAAASAIGRHLFSDRFVTPLVAALHGDSSGVRGAAWLWPGREARL